MNLKKAILYGVLLWVFSFVVVSVIMFIPVLADKLQLQSILNKLAVLILVLILAASYFKKSPAKFAQGLLVGVVWVLVGTILDLAITLPLFVRPSGQNYADFYGDWLLWLGLVLTVLLTGI